jgi:AhpD family alkylhydroperoxidase
VNMHTKSSEPDAKATAHQPRLNYAEQSPQAVKKLTELVILAHSGSIEEPIRDLVALRASQINGCAFCIDMHVKEAKMHGERELRLYHVSAWRESPLFAPRERAALAWTEIMTRLPEGGVPDEIYEKVRTQLSEKEISDLTFFIAAINSWNRLGVGFKTVPGSLDAMYGLAKAGLN